MADLLILLATIGIPTALVIRILRISARPRYAPVESTIRIFRRRR